MKNKKLLVIVAIPIVVLLSAWLVINKDTLQYDLGRCPAPFSAMEFDDVEDFDDGLARIKYREQWGFIDIHGNIAIPMRAAYLDSFSEGLAAAQDPHSGKFGYIDRQNNIVIPFIYDSAKPFQQGIAEVGLEKYTQYTMIDQTGKEIMPHYRRILSYDSYLMAEKQGSEYADFYDLSGKPLTGERLQQLRKEERERKAQERAWNVMSDAQRAKEIERRQIENIVIMNHVVFNRKEDMQPEMTAYRNGVALKREDNYVWYLVNQAEEKLAGPFYSVEITEEGGVFYPFAEDAPLIPVYRSGVGAGYIDAQGKERTPFIYTHNGLFHEGRARIGKAFKTYDPDPRSPSRSVIKYGFIDAQGNEIVSPRYWEAHNYIDGWAAVRQGNSGKWRFIDKQGCAMTKP